MFFVRESKYIALKEKHDALLSELKFTKQRLLVEEAASKKYREVAKHCNETADKIADDFVAYRRANPSGGKTPIKEVVPKKNQIMRSSEAKPFNNDYVVPSYPQGHVVFLGDTFSPPVMDRNPIVGSGGSFGGGGASASWSDDSCSKSYGGSDSSSDSSSSCSDTSSSSSSTD